MDKEESRRDMDSSDSVRTDWHPLSVNRYRMGTERSEDGSMIWDAEGEWVSYTSYCKAVEKLLDMNKKDANR